MYIYKNQHLSKRFMFIKEDTAFINWILRRKIKPCYQLEIILILLCTGLFFCDFGYHNMMETKFYVGI